MTKALEAAEDMLRTWFQAKNAPAMDENEKWRNATRQIIRAYAANVTEEMAAECAGAVGGCQYCDPDELKHWKASPEQIQAAIERGLV